MGNTESRFDSALEKMPDHVLNLESWKAKRHAFIMLMYDKIVIRNLFGLSEESIFGRGLQRESKCNLSEHTMTQLSDISLFLTCLLDMPKLVYVAADTGFVSVGTCWKIPKNVGKIKGSVEKEGYEYRLINTLICLSAKLNEESATAKETPKTGTVFPEDALNKLKVGTMFSMNIEGRRDKQHCVYVGRTYNYNKKNLKWHVFVYVGESGLDWQFSKWHDICRRRAFLTAFALFPVLRSCEAIFQIVIRTPWFGTLVDRELFHAAVESACNVHLRREQAAIAGHSTSIKK